MRKKAVNLFLLVLTTALLTTACGGGSETSSSSTIGPLDLLRDNVSRVEFFAVSEIQGGSAPRSFEKDFDRVWKDYSAGDALTIDDIDVLVRAGSGQDTVRIASGQLDFAATREWLSEEESGWESTSYQGEELWELDTAAIVLLESEGYMINGATDLVKDILKVREGNADSLAQAEDNRLKQAYEAASGWYVLAGEDCTHLFSAELRSCEAYSVSGSTGDEDFLVDITYRFLFRTDNRAEDAEFDVEDGLEAFLGRGADLKEIKTDGTVVRVKATADQEDFQTEWLGRLAGAG